MPKRTDIRTIGTVWQDGYGPVMKFGEMKQ
jgi:hypothetical protein